MRSEDRRRRFHEALLRKLYPPPSPRSDEEEEKSQSKPEDTSFDVTLINPDDYLETAPTINEGDEVDESEDSQKMSRAQRKKLRKKKLKEEASHRGKLIGPLLPQTMMEEASRETRSDDGGCSHDEDDESGMQCVRRNADVKNGTDLDISGKRVGDEAESDDYVSGKAKKRRLAKRIAKQRLQSSV